MKEKKSYNTIYVYRLITRKEIGGIREKERNCAMKKEIFLFSYLLKITLNEVIMVLKSSYFYD